MSLKQEITRTFNKKRFHLANLNDDVKDNGSATDGTWEVIDAYIRTFMQRLNQSPDITTHFSCEGHKNGDSAYLYFNTSKKGWDIFWLEIMPELSFQFHRELDENSILQLEWMVQAMHNEHGSGICITCNLESGDLRDWKEQKKHFWDEVQHSFLTHFFHKIKK